VLVISAALLVVASAPPPCHDASHASIAKAVAASELVLTVAPGCFQ